MTGLLESLDELLNTTSLDALVGDQAIQLNGVIGAVQGLADGPTALLDLENSINNAPIPPGLDGIGNLSTELSTLTVPTDFSEPLAPILSPLTELSTVLVGRGATQANALLDLVREIIRLITGRVFGGASGMPDGSGIDIPDLPDVEELRLAISQAQTVISDFGPRLDAAKILDFLQQGSLSFSEPLVRFPNLPVLDEVMESLKTVATWQQLTADQLNANLARTLEMAAKLIDTPYTRVAQPVLTAAQAVNGGTTTLATTQTTLTEVFSTLRPKILSPAAKPNNTELRRLELAANDLEEIAAAVHPQTSPLAHIQTLDEDLTRALLVVLRALQPAFDISPVAARVQELLAQLPAAPSDIFDEVITTIEAFDLSALTGTLQDVRTAIESAVEAVNDAQATVRDQLLELLTPLETALNDAFAAAGFNEIQTALNGLPGDIQDFVDNEILPALDPIRDGIDSAVGAVSDAADGFDPEALIAPLRQAVEQVAALFESEAVQGAFAEVENVLNTVIQSLENFDIGAAADESIRLMDEIKIKVADIDPASIPDAAKPILAQAVSVVADINFSVEVSAPISEGLQQAIVAGPQAILALLEQSMDEVRSRLVQFRPSQVLSEPLNQPFEDLMATLDQFQPSDLLNRLQETLNGLTDRLNVLDVGSVVDPLLNLYTTLQNQIAALRPSVLLEPVNQAIESAVEQVYEVTQIDTVFDGINDALDYIQSWTGLLADSRDFLRQAATLFSQPGDATAAVETLVEESIAKLDEVDLSRLQGAFTQASQAVQRIQRDAIAGPLAKAIQQAGQQGPVVLNSPAAQQVVHLVRSFPLAELRSHISTHRRDRLIEVIERLLRAADTLETAKSSWADMAPQLHTAAGNLQEELLDYYKLQQLNGGGVLGQFRNPPTTVAALKDAVREALADGLQAPLTTVVTVVQAFSPYLELLAQGFSDLFDAVHQKVDSIVGDEGIGGVITAAEDAANLLRNIDLSPISDPLDSLYGRIENAVGALNPEPLRAVLVAAQQAIGDLLNISTLLDQSTIDTLNNTYQDAVNKLKALAPGEIIADLLDPLYEDLLADILPILDLPIRLRELTESASLTISQDVVRELARVEVSFDEMLRAIPLSTGAGSVQGSISGSIG